MLLGTADEGRYYAATGAQHNLMWQKKYPVSRANDE